MSDKSLPATPKLQDCTRGMFYCRFEVPEQGFSWDDAVRVAEFDEDTSSEPPGPWLLAPVPLNVEFPARYCFPLRTPDLHRRFSRLRPTQARVLSFANRYGFLGVGRQLYRPGLEKQPILVGEDLDTWVGECVKLRALVELWDLVTTENREELRRYVTWRSDPCEVAIGFGASSTGLLPELFKAYRLEPRSIVRGGLLREARDRQDIPHIEMGWWRVAHQQMRRGPELLARWEFGDSLEPARYFVHHQINERLKGQTTVAVLPFLDGEIYSFPGTLLASLYALFARAIAKCCGSG